jgi:hypothetical protein
MPANLDLLKGVIMDIGTILTVATGLAGGYLGKKVGKDKAVGGDLPMHKLFAPLLAATAAGSVQSTIDPTLAMSQLVESGGKWGLIVVGVYAIIKGVQDILKYVWHLRRTADGSDLTGEK